MVSRKGRSRKTSDRMAVYKAAAANGVVRQSSGEREDSIPIRVSPRTSPRTKLSNASAQNSTSLDVPTKLGNGDHNSISPDKVNIINKQLQSRFEVLEEVPETPPRPNRPPNKKRVMAPERMSVSKRLNVECGSGDESEMPSKKRKTFKTPPRGSSAKNRGNVATMNESSPVVFGARGSTTSSPSVRSDLLEASDVGDSPCAQHSSIPSLDKDDSMHAHMRDERKSLQERRNSKPIHRELSHPRERGEFPVNRTRLGSQALGDESLNVLNLSSTVMSRLLESFGMKMMSEFRVMQKQNIDQMRKIADTVNESVSSQMQHMEGLFTMISRGMTGLRQQKTSVKSSLTEWEQKLNALTVDVDVIFNKEVLGRVLCYNSSVKATSVFRGHEGAHAERAALSAQTLLFSLQPGEKKFSFSGKIGALHSEFKFITVQNSFFNVSRNGFGFFSDSDSVEKIRSTSGTSHDSGEYCMMGSKHLTSTGERKRIKRPDWLQKGKVNSDHINEARGFLERANQSRKSKVRRTPGPDDIAIHAALRVYRLLGNYLHVRRGAVRNRFFQGLGYLLVHWSDHVQDNDQRNMTISWKYDDPGLVLCLDSIPCTEQCNINADDATVTAVDASNKNLLRKLFSDCPEMVLAVEHDVHVVNGSGTQRRHVGGEVASIRRLINLIDVACDVCAEYCGVESIEMFLRGHRYALQCVMIFALLFKAFCVEFMERRKNADSRTAGLNAYDPAGIVVGGMSLKDLIPGPSTQKNLLGCRCLRMTRDEFELFNHRDDENDPEEEDRENGLRGFEMVEIEESEEMGIGMI